MSQQISIDDAFPTFQKRCRELFEENLFLRAQVDVLQRRISELEKQPEHESTGGEPYGGPDQNPSTM